jgi:hypothetical protein
MRLLKAQRAIAEENFDTTVFVEGAAGTGKTTAAIERVKNLLKAGIPAESILVLVAQPALAIPYREALRRSRVTTGGSVSFATLGSLAIQTIDLCWPLIASDVGFTNPLERPHFLSLELIQYYMTRFIEPEIRRQDYFNSVHVTRNRLYTQIVDNLNKAAVVRFSHEDISSRLKSAAPGDVEQASIYDDVQACAILFRDMCRQYNLLDFSLQMVLFAEYLWQMKQPRRYLTDQYRHLIIENVEENTPIAHDLLADWIKECDSAVVLYDTDAGYRRFLGADPVNAYNLRKYCQVQVELSKPRQMSPEMEAFQHEIARSLNRPHSHTPTVADPRAAIVYPQDDVRYFPQMIDWTVDNIASLVEDEGVSPDEIVILSAYLPDALRFSLQTRLDERGIPNRTHRPSRALREEPAARTLLTLARLAHPDWKTPPDKLDLTYALTASIAELDLIRARLLVDMLYRDGQLSPFSRIQEARAQSRITFEMGERYEKLRKWLERYGQNDPLPLDVFLSKLFGEVLSQPKFGFHRQFDAANTAANLIDSAREFRQTLNKIEPDLPHAAEYMRMVDSGVIANQYVRDWEGSKKPSVLLAPAYTFLMNNQAVDYQFWLNVGSAGWGQRLEQPLTQPYVLSRQWEVGNVWTDAEEFETNQESLYELVAGLARRCRKRLYLGISQYGEQGVEQRGALLMAIQGMLRRLNQEEQHV